MTPDRDTNMDLEIDAFVNGQLDGERRFAVAAFLARHPDRAAEVMSDLHLTEGLRLALGTIDAPPDPRLDLAAARVSRGLETRHRLRHWAPFAAAAAMFVVGWTAQSLVSGSALLMQGSGTAEIFETALDAQDAVSLRLMLSGELGPMSKDAQAISDRLGIPLPDLPAGWSVRAAQVVATPDRPGIALVIDTPNLGEIMLFSVRRSDKGPGAAADTPVDTTTQDGRLLAVFEKGQAAYVLVDNSGPLNDLRRGAEELRHSLTQG